MIQQTHCTVYTQRNETGSQRDICTLMFTVVKQWEQPWRSIAGEYLTKCGIYDGFISSFKNEENSGTCYIMDDSWGPYAKQTHLITNRFCSYYVYKIVSSIKTENKMIFSRGWEEKCMWSCLMSRVSVLPEENCPGD